jgi:hypothetical protein
VAKTLSADTSPAVEARLMEAYRSMEPWQKLRIVSELSKAAFELAAAGIRMRAPAASDQDVQLILAARRLGRDTVLRATGRRALPGEE